MKNNVLFILLDGCEFSTFENRKVASKLAPNISNLMKTGILKKIISNGQITQVSLPTILTQTYPLDFDGYNNGIRSRPKSIIEIFRDEGYDTSFIAAHNSITGPRRGFERGANFVKSIFDFDDTIEDFIRNFIYYELKKFDEKKINEKELIKIIKQQFSSLLNYMISSNDRVNYFFLPRRLRVQKEKIKIKLKAELEILKKNPQDIIKKIKLVPSRFYNDYLGIKPDMLNKVNLDKIIKIKKIIYNFKEKFNGIFKQKSGLGFSPFSIYVSPTASEVFRTVDDFLNTQNSKLPWFIFVQLEDIHDGPKTCRFFNFIFKLKYLKRLLKIRKKYSSHRDFWRDLSLIYLDSEFGKFFKRLKKRKMLNNTIFYLFGDHGMGWDNKRDKSLMNNLGVRTHYEHIEVPLIISPCNKKPYKGMHDGMSISATLLSELGFKKHKSFKGKTIFSKSKEASIVENTGRGYCDFKNRDIFFTITTVKYKGMFVLINKKLHPMRLYDKENDPNEYKNLLEEKIDIEAINFLVKFLIQERKELLVSRGVNLKKILNKEEKWVVKEYKLDSYKSPRYYSRN